MPVEPLLTATELAAQTGVPAGTLRVWASRYGFPAGRHRRGPRHRYGEADVEAIRIVQRLRSEGLTLSAAIAQASAVRPAVQPSIFAGLRSRQPELRVIRLRKPALLQLTHAIEDEHCARAGDGLLLGSFQRERNYRASEYRWRELARTTRCSIAVADFQQLRAPVGAPVEVPIAADHQLGREWLLIVDSAVACACLAALELPGSAPTPDGARMFEVIWSCEPAIVAQARALTATLLASIAPAVAESLSGLPVACASAENQQRFASDLAARAYEYLAARYGESD
ncbi:MAG: DICT sensory domain-containing protein [Solirubrobacteraceae bacterium]